MVSNKFSLPMSRLVIVTLAACFMLAGAANLTISSPETTLQKHSPASRVTNQQNRADESDYSLAWATWALVCLTGILSFVTWRSAKEALTDACRMRREMFERELNTSAHRAAATAEHVGQLAGRVPLAAERLISLSGTIPKVFKASPDTVTKERLARVESIKEHALSVVQWQFPRQADVNLSETQRRLDEHLVQLDVLKEEISGELQLLVRETDAAERDTVRKIEKEAEQRRQIDEEVGQCNRLIFLLGQMVQILLDIQDQLFESPRQRLGRAPEWHEIGALVGAPMAGPTFIIGEFVFLLKSDDPGDQSPELLARIYNAESNFKQILARLEERSQLWNDCKEASAATQFVRGEVALEGMQASGYLIARLKEITKWLDDDLNEWIPSLKSIFPDLYRVLEKRYPGRRFLRFWPKDDAQSPPL